MAAEIQAVRRGASGHADHRPGACGHAEDPGASHCGRLRRMGLGARRLAARLLDLALPPLCSACAAPVTSPGLCLECWRQVRFLAGPLCPVCGEPKLPADGDPTGTLRTGPCGNCRSLPPAFTQARAAVAYGGPVRRMVLTFKHGDRLELAPLFVRWMLAALTPVQRGADLIVPVPMPWRRLVVRRANQAAELSRRLAAALPGRHAPQVLRRVRTTPMQGRLSRAARRRNVAGAFAVPARHCRRVSGAYVLLVDDVMTTGATVDACAAALVAAGAARVDVVTLARATRRAGPPPMDPPPEVPPAGLPPSGLRPMGLRPVGSRPVGLP